MKRLLQIALTLIVLGSNGLTATAQSTDDPIREVYQSELNRQMIREDKLRAIVVKRNGQLSEMHSSHVAISDSLIVTNKVLKKTTKQKKFWKGTGISALAIIILQSLSFLRR